MPTTPAPAIPATLLEEHQHVRRLAQSLEKLAYDLPESMVLVHRALAELTGVLSDHFAAEERSGMFEAIVQDRPELARACGRLRDQHRAILGLMQGLCDTGPVLGHVAEKSGWAGRLRRALVELESHEEQENAVVAQAAAPEGTAPD